VVFLGYSAGYALLACAGVTFVLRSGSIMFGWGLPVYRTKPPHPESPKQS
jgi:uncharacterized membrane protein YeiH